jgi:hypothetical protein
VRICRQRGNNSVTIGSPGKSGSRIPRLPKGINEENSMAANEIQKPPLGRIAAYSDVRGTDRSSDVRLEPVRLECSGNQEED